MNKVENSLTTKDAGQDDGRAQDVSVKPPVNDDPLLMKASENSSIEITTRPNSLVRLVPRALLTASLVFWFALCVLMFPTLRQMAPLQMIILGILAVCSSTIVIHLGTVTTGILRRELNALAKLARRDQANETAEFAYDEFSVIAKQIQSSNTIVRDELENLRLAAYRDMSNGLPNRLSLIPELARAAAQCGSYCP